ncbi:hypothetical protein ElyMa_002534500 [Elysia marginata]|uniref:Uncharacterized protein n=1 Tax=Elysia marginata TaxID=1093978 RepID=A0AAV4GVB2_9GAST|nr:hypothetical protein ElyMa_002534500 [Elysia marginata]
MSRIERELTPLRAAALLHRPDDEPADLTKIPRASDPLDKIRAYLRMAGAAVDSPPLPVFLMPETQRQALFRSLIAILPAKP